MDRQVKTRMHTTRNIETYVSAVSPTNMQVQLVESDQGARLSPLTELTIVGGLGVFIMIAPNVATFVKQKLHQVKTQIILLKGRLGHTRVTKKLEVLNRRRKVGSLIRVIGSVLPSSLFTPPCRIYIPNWTQLGNSQWRFAPPDDLPIFEVFKKSDLPTENDVGDGLIEAFELDSEVIGSVSEDDENEDEADYASSCPEGWTQEQRKFAGNFNPTIINATDLSFARCSTPKANVETLHFNASQIFNQQGSKMYDDQADITELKKMVEGLMLQINCLNQSLLTTQNQLAAQQQTPMSSTSQPSAALVSNTLPQASIPASRVVPPLAGPPPPPPPPPPMPPMPSFEKKPLIITKKGNQDKLLEKKPQISLSDVLKELPNAKLRRIERSPGGTPLKPQLTLAKEKVPLDIGNQLAFALRKRYESMHSPACETDTDKENMEGSDDSFEDSPVCAKRILFPAKIRSPRKRSSGGNLNNENCSPFGQHLLKKRNVVQAKEDSPSSSVIFALREQN